MNTAPTPSLSAAASASGPLAPGALLSLRISRNGLQLQVSRGRLWVTLQGQPDDHFVAAGEALPLPRGARLLLECDSPEAAHWQLAEPAQPAQPTAARVADNRRHEPARTAPHPPALQRP